MSVLEVPADVEEKIAVAIRRNVLRVIELRGLDEVGNELGIHPVGVESLLWSSRWTLPIAVRVAALLGLSDGEKMEDAVSNNG